MDRTRTSPSKARYDAQERRPLFAIARQGEGEDDGMSDLVGIASGVGAVLSYILVYAFRLGEAIRYRFDPSLITVSINNFLTVLIPFASCAAYLVLGALFLRDMRRKDSLRGRTAASRRTARSTHLGHVWLTMLAGGLVALPFLIALGVNRLQTSPWISLVIGAGISLGVLATLVRKQLGIAPLTWTRDVMRRGSRGASVNPVRGAIAVVVLCSALLALFLFSGYTNQLDFIGSHTLMLTDPQSGETYAVLALFDGNRAVVRDARPIDAGAEDPVREDASEEESAYSVDLSEPYRVVYLTDGYNVSQASHIETSG